MGDARVLCQADLLKFNWLRANILEQSDPFAEQYRYQVYFDLIEPSGFDKLLDDICASYPLISLSPAAAFAFFRALSAPSVTKVYDVSPCLTTVSFGLWLSTYTGA